jgi:hypothetical protein
MDKFFFSHRLRSYYIFLYDQDKLIVDGAWDIKPKDYNKRIRVNNVMVKWALARNDLCLLASAVWDRDYLMNSIIQNVFNNNPLVINEHFVAIDIPPLFYREGY